MRVVVEFRRGSVAELVRWAMLGALRGTHLNSGYAQAFDKAREVLRTEYYYTQYMLLTAHNHPWCMYLHCRTFHNLHQP